MKYTKADEYENEIHIHKLIEELVKSININLVLKAAEDGRFGMAYETGSNRLELWGLGGSVKLEIY